MHQQCQILTHQKPNLRKGDSQSSILEIHEYSQRQHAHIFSMFPLMNTMTILTLVTLYLLTWLGQQIIFIFLIIFRFDDFCSYTSYLCSVSQQHWQGDGQGELVVLIIPKQLVIQSVFVMNQLVIQSVLIPIQLQGVS